MRYTTGYARKPAIFVSSTCYDLKQVRQNIRDFIENDLGYEAILSEYDSFPTDPSMDTVNNCLRVVEERADIFVLIVGGRYGYVTDHEEKSITNLEYLRAKYKGIPIYIFVEQTILNILPVWESNPNGDFSDVVDSNKVFTFVKELRNIDSNWVHEFRNANEIISSLKLQLAYLVNDSILLRQHIVKDGVSPKILKYSGKVFEIAIEKPTMWEYRLFAEVLNDNLERLDDLKYDLKYGITFKPVVMLEEPQEILSMVQAKNNELLQRVGFLNPIINEALKEAWGEPGQPGNAEYIVYVAEKIVDIFKGVHEWSLDFKNIVVPNEFQGLLLATSQLSESIINDIEEFVQNYTEGIEQLIMGISDGKEKRKVEFCLNLSIPNVAKVNEEIEKIKNIYGIS